MFDVISFCKDYNIPFIVDGKHTSNGWVNIQCPMSGCIDNDFHGGVNLNGAYYNCWKCGGASLENLVKTILNIYYEEAKELIYTYTTKYKLHTYLNSDKKEKHKKIIDIKMPGKDLLKIHKKYLIKRGFDVDYIVNKYKIKGVGPTPTAYAFRIMIPIFDSNNKLISYQGRDVTNKDKIKYKGCSLDESIMNYKYTLYGLNQIISQNQVCVVEGVFDQWKMGNGFVATFGTALTDYQIKLLSKFKKVFFLFDSEKHTQQKAMQYAKQLAVMNVKTEVIDLELDDKDPGDLELKEIKYIRKELNFI